MILSNLSISMFSQNNVSSDSKHSQMFSLSPISKKVDKVNGLVFGVGHVENKNIDSQTINGLNIEANPAPIAGALISFIAIMHLPDVIKINHGKVPTLLIMVLKLEIGSILQN